MKIKRTISLLIAVTLIATMFCGIASQGAATKAKEPAKITIFITQHPDDRQTDTCAWTKYINNKLNIKIHWIMVPYEAVTEKRSILLASKNVPDLVNISCQLANLYGEEDVFLDADNLIKKYAPNCKEVLDKKTTAHLRNDKGMLYAIPGTYEASMYPCAGLIYRKDIIDKLGLKEPDTLDDWYAVLKKAKEKYPDYRILSTAGGGSGVFGLLANEFCLTGQYINLTNNFTKVEFTPVSENYKKLLMYARKLYSDGILDKDYITLDFNTWWSSILAGKSFSWYGNFARSSYAKLEAEKGGVKIQPVAWSTPKNLTGKREFYSTVSLFFNEYAFAVSSRSKVAKEAMSLINWAWSKEGTAHTEFGIMGKVFKKEGGNIVPILKGDAALNQYRKDGGGNGQPVYWIRDRRGDLYNFSPPEWVEMIDGMKRNRPYLVQLPLYTIKNTNEQKEAASIQAAVDTYARKCMDEFIIGKMSFDKWDEYVKGFDALNYKRLVEINQKALADFNSKLGK